MAQTVLVSFQDISLGYGAGTILHQMNWQICAGDYFALVGPNGCGKTTVIKAMLGMLSPLHGRIELASSLSIGYVAQRETLHTHFPLTAHDIVLMGLYKRIGAGKSPSKQDCDKARHVLAEVGIADKADTVYRDLSGGQKQRLLLARAIISEPQLLLLDEPTNGMDIAGEQIILDLIENVARRQSMTVLLITHNLNLIAGRARSVGIITVNGMFRCGPAQEIMESATLSALYGCPVLVVTEQGRTMVLVQGAK